MRAMSSDRVYATGACARARSKGGVDGGRVRMYDIKLIQTELMQIAN